MDELLINMAHTWERAFNLSRNGDATPIQTVWGLLRCLSRLDSYYGYHLTPAIRQITWGTSHDSILPELQIVEYGRFSYIRESREVITPYPEHTTVQLSKLNGELIALLMANGGRYVPRSRLFDVWGIDQEGGIEVSPDLLKTHINGIRKKIGDREDLIIAGRNTYRHIRSLTGVGYGFFDSETPVSNIKL